MAEEKNSEIEESQKSKTVYDDAFKSMSSNCKDLFIPVVNEMFGEKYSKNAEMKILSNEYYPNNPDGDKESKRADMVFTLSDGGEAKKYHVECQSTVDKTMIVRIFEYATQIALDKQTLKDLLKPSSDNITVKFPRSAVLYLRSRKTTPDSFTINVEISEQTIPYKIPIMKAKDYSVDKIFEKDLLFLIPFHLFALEKKFSEYNDDETKLFELRAEYEKIADKLNKLYEEGKLKVNDFLEIFGWTKQVAKQLAKNYKNVSEGVGKAMSGRVIRLPETEVYYNGFDKGLAQGIEQGLEQGRAEMAKQIEIIELENKRKDKEMEILRKKLALAESKLKSRGAGR